MSTPLDVFATIPSEIWTRIFSFSCVDGGTNGFAISLTCKAFHEAVVPVRLQSVAVFGRQKIQHLRKMLALDEELPKQLHALNIVGFAPRTNASTQETNTVGMDIINILTLTSPTVSILRVVDYSSSFPSTLLDFRALVELTLRGESPLKWVVASSIPTLRRLCLTETHLELPKMAGIIQTFAPELTHLRLVPTQVLTSALVDGLRAAMHLKGSNYTQAKNLFPSKLVRILFHPGQTHPKEGIPGGAQRFAHEIRRLYEMASEDPRFVVLGFNRSKPSWEQENLRDWNDTVAGDSGFWSGVPRE